MTWSWVLAGLGLAGLFLAGDRRRLGWLICLGAQPVWVVYAVATEQHGFIISAVAYAGVYARNWWAWRRAITSVGQHVETTGNVSRHA